MRERKFLVLLAVAAASTTYAADEAIDASDPTKIYSYAGGGIKFTDYTNNETMTEIRANGNLGFGPKNMVMFEPGYGFHDGDLKNEGAGNFDINLGGAISPTLLVGVNSA